MSSSHPAPRERSANIFINYRREDSAGHAGRLFDALGRHFAGRLFMDVDTLDPGVDFVDAIEQAVGSCEALIVVIGRDWLTAEDKAGRRRLEDPGDFVRLEIESALARRIRVIPVLVQDAPMPRTEELPASLAKLARRNAIELSDARWSYDVDRLARTIRDVLKEKHEPAKPAASKAEDVTFRPTPVAPVVAVEEKGTRSRAWLLSAAAAVLVAAVVLVSVAWMRNDLQAAVGPAEPKAAASPAVGAGIGASTSATTNAATSATGVTTTDPGAPPTVAAATPRPVVAEPSQVVEPPRVVETPAVHHAVEGSRPPVNTMAVSLPIATPKPATIVVDAAAVHSAAAADPPPMSTPAPSARPARATIMSPRSGEVVGPDVMVQGVVSGLGEQQIFLGIRQTNGRIYPRGELFPNAEGVWSIKLRSSKERNFEILVVTATTREASQVLRDQRSRDDGVTALPEGAFLGSGAVALKRQGRIRGILNPKDENGD